MTNVIVNLPCWNKLQQGHVRRRMSGLFPMNETAKQSFALLAAAGVCSCSSVSYVWANKWRMILLIFLLEQTPTGGRE